MASTRAFKWFTGRKYSLLSNSSKYLKILGIETNKTRVN